MEDDRIKISEAEWEVMRVIWTLGKVDATTLANLLSDAMNWQLATIKTLLGRLVKKGALQTETKGKKFIYSANVSEAQLIRQATEELFSHICTKKRGRFLADLIKENELSSSDIQLLHEILDNKMANDQIKCNCIPGQCRCKK